MADVLIEGTKTKDKAIKLLGAAAKLNLPASAVKSVYNGFLVPEEVAKEFSEADKPKKTRTTKAKAPAKADDTKEGND